MKNNWIQELKSLNAGDLLEKVSGAAFTTYRIGGTVEALVFPYREKLPELLSFIRNKQIPFYVLGAGSNLLISDRGFKGIFINLMRYYSYHQIEGERVQVGAGKLVMTLIEELETENLGGMERLYGIPGTLGGGIKMNIRAFGCEISEFVTGVKVYRQEELKTLSPVELGFAYRRSSIGDEDVIVEVELKLQEKEKEKIRKVREEIMGLRKEKQPLQYASCGSTFKNPSSELSAGELIDRAGLKGRACGDAQISPKHANFIINRGKARAKDIITLMKQAREKVYHEFGILLEPEVKLVGFPEGVLD